MFLKNLQSDFKTNLTELNLVYQGTFEAYQASNDLLEAIKGDPPLIQSEINILLNQIINKLISSSLNGA